MSEKTEVLRAKYVHPACPLRIKNRPEVIVYCADCGKKLVRGQQRGIEYLCRLCSENRRNERKTANSTLQPNPDLSPPQGNPEIP